MKPLFNNVVLKKELVNQTTNSGIVLTTKKEETKYATVVAVGNGILADGTKVEMPVKVGDKVYYKLFIILLVILNIHLAFIILLLRDY